MTENQFRELERGDIIRHKFRNESAIVDGVYGGRVTAVRTYDVTNPEEWQLVVPRSVRSTRPPHAERGG